MNPEPEASQSRREFLRTVALSAGIAALPATARAADSADVIDASPVAGPSVYLAFGPEEAAFVEALVEVMCPKDEFTPGGVECGLAIFMDRQIAGAFGQGERLYRSGPWRTGRPEDGYQRPLTPVQFFRAGIQAADQVCVHTHGRGFAQLSASEADAFLAALADGHFPDAAVPLTEWFNELVYPLFTQACFADPIYGGNRNKVFWEMVGYPGLPAVNGLNMVKYRGQPFPGRRAPKSIEDFS